MDPSKLMMNPEFFKQITQTATQVAQNLDIPQDQSPENIDMGSLAGAVSQAMGQLMKGGAMQDMAESFEKSQNMNTTNTTHTTDSNPFENMLDSIDEDVSEEENKTPDLHLSIDVELEDFVKGKTKKIRVKRKRFVPTSDNKSKRVLTTEKKLIKIPIEKGMEDGQVIRFTGDADEHPDKEPGDIVITLMQNPHPTFMRKDANLFMEREVKLGECFDNSFYITTIYGERIKVETQPEDLLYLNDGIRKIPHKGMPKFREDDRGDLYIRFNLDLPEKISPENLIKLREIFPIENPVSVDEDVNETIQLDIPTEEDLEMLNGDSDSEYDSNSEDNEDLLLEDEDDENPYNEDENSYNDDSDDN